MSYYENVFIARQDISQPQAEALGDAFAKVVDDFGGKVTKREYWGLRNLSFRIKKNRKGHYTLLNIEAPAAAVKEMERTMSINEDVLRYLTVRVDALEEGPSAMMLRGEKSDRPSDRGDRGDRGDRWERPRRERPRFGEDGAPSNEPTGDEA